MMNASAVISLVARAEASGIFFPEGASTFAPQIDGVFNFILWVCIVFFALIVGLMAWFLVKYRRRDNYDGEESPSHSTFLEVSWSVLPFLIVCYMFYEGMVGYMDMKSPPAEAYEIKVRAKKWAWDFTYPNGHITNELHVPMGTPIVLTMQSDDVLHSLFVPVFRVKMDVVPGRYTKLWFIATRESPPEGFDLECTEYCGTKHSEMLAKVFVHPDRASYDKWLEVDSDPFRTRTPVEVGKLYYERRGCVQCHSNDPAKTKKTGPAWWGIYGEEHEFTDGTKGPVDENYIRESILKPTAKVVKGYAGNMPSFAGQLKDRDIDAIIEYIKTLK